MNRPNVIRIDGKPYIAPVVLHRVVPGIIAEPDPIDAWAAERIQPAKPTFGERLVTTFRGNETATFLCVATAVFTAAVFIAAYAGRLGQ